MSDYDTYGFNALINENNLPFVAKVHIVALWLIVCVLIVIAALGYKRRTIAVKESIPKTIVESLSEGFKACSSMVKA